ncbi:SLC13 family permease [Candidatus Borrarchaeum sp.]|uniref:SLC13 family permease n=1 Tax=Candidatus Borrarchaeum sp. TaxID=2846742 RepID=UPI002580AEBB|nr:SLC13 family permease [Candidatus Borrarchaeum sp.]
MIPFTVIMIIAYILIASDKINKTLVAIGGAAVTMTVAYIYFFAGTEIFTEKEVLTELVDWGAIIIILSLLVIVEVSKSSGILNYLTVTIIKLTKGDTEKILFYTNALVFILSAFLGDESAFLIVGGITLVLVKNMKLDPMPFLLTEVVSSNAASCASITSSLTNIIIASNFSFAPEYYLSYDRFLLIAFPFSLLIFGINLVIGKHLVRDRFVCVGECITESEIEIILALEAADVVKNTALVKRFFLFFAALIIGFILAGFLGIPFFLIALIGSITLILITGEYSNIDKIIKRIDWSTIIFFFGVFIIVGGVASVGLLNLIGEAIGRLSGGNKILIWLTLIVTSGVIAAFVDSVSIALMLLYIIPSVVASAGITTPASVIWSVILAVNLGDILSPLGGVNSVLIFLMFKREKIKFSFLDFMRVGGILSALNFTLVFLYILFISSILGW